MYLGEYWVLALVCPLTWLIVTHWIKLPTLGMNTLVAGMLVGIMWALALVFGNEELASFFFETGLGKFLYFVLLIVLIVVPGLLVLFLDRYTTFGLKRC